MKSEMTINEPKKVADYFPCLFANPSKSIIILADGRTGDKTFSGMVVHSENEKKNVVGTYGTCWTYEQFKRLPKGTNVIIGLTQDE